MTQKVVPVSVEENGELIDVRFDLALVIDKDNNLQVVDKTQRDWKDIVDCNTLLVHDVKISV